MRITLEIPDKKVKDFIRELRQADFRPATTVKAVIQEALEGLVELALEVDDYLDSDPNAVEYVGEEE